MQHHGLTRLQPLRRHAAMTLDNLGKYRKDTLGELSMWVSSPMWEGLILDSCIACMVILKKECESFFFLIISNQLYILHTPVANFQKSFPRGSFCPLSKGINFFSALVGYKSRLLLYIYTPTCIQNFVTYKRIFRLWRVALARQKTNFWCAEG